MHMVGIDDLTITISFRISSISIHLSSNLYSMDRTKVTIRLFLHKDCSDQEPTHASMQAMINYMTSRLWNIFIAAIAGIDSKDEMQWWTANMQAELVCWIQSHYQFSAANCMSQQLALAVVGYAHAIGSYPDIPLLLRSLADSLFFKRFDTLVIPAEIFGLLSTHVDCWDGISLSGEMEYDWWMNPDNREGPIKQRQLIDTVRAWETEVFPLLANRYYFI